MASQADTARSFHTLHAGPRPLVLFNVWDAGSAKAVADAGARALATGSWSVAAAHGYADGEHMPFELALANLSRIVEATALPVTVDLESGYGDTAEAVGQTVARAIEAGAVGCNLEDSLPGDGRLRATDEQARRLAHARKAADERGIALFLNARTDVFFQKPAAQHHAAMVAQALDRANAYAKAGADGLFVPGLANPDLIAALVAASPLPVNIMVGADTPPVPRLAALGVARISHGPGPYLLAMRHLAEAARAAEA